MTSAGAKPAAGYTYGRELHPVERALPGDVMQFEAVELADGMKLGVPNHTAVIARVLGPRKYELLHQNMGNSKIVRTDTIDLSILKRGKVQIWRAVRS